MRGRIELFFKKVSMRLFLMASILAFCCLNLMATAINPFFTVQDVIIDVQDVSATQARSKAIYQAQRTALQQLFSRLYPNASTDGSFEKKILSLSDDVIEGMIQDFEIQSEKVSAQRYKGTFTFHFKNEEVQQFFATFKEIQNSAALTVGASTTLIIPLQQQGDKLLLWEETNLWRQFWEEKKPSTSPSTSPSFLIPLGDLKDRTSLTSRTAKQGGVRVFQPLMDRYRADRVLIVILDQDKTPPMLQLSLYSARGLEWVKPLLPLENTSVSPLWQNAFDHTLQQLQDLNPATFLQNQRSAKIQCFISFSTFKNWRDIQYKLSQNPLLPHQSLDSLSLHNATMTLTFLGDKQMLIEGLRAQDFLVEETSPKSTRPSLTIRTREPSP